ncbi:tetratricopeptide repeat protein, partial [Candidatus Omnitrophota bacterium]
DVMDSQSILEQIQLQAMDVIAGHSSDLPQRHHTLREAIDWSYQLLNDTQQRCFCRLSVFFGGFTLEAAQEVCGESTVGLQNVGKNMAALVRKSLLYLGTGAQGKPRYRMLDMIREYCLEQLEINGDVEAARESHAHFFLELSNSNTPEFWGPPDKEKLEILDYEYDNLLNAIQYLLEVGEVDSALILGKGLGWYCTYRGRASIGRQCLEQVLAASDNASPAAVVRCLSPAATLAWCQADYTSARRLWNDALPLTRELCPSWVLALLLNSLAWTACFQGDYEDAVRKGEDAFTIGRKLDDKWSIACSLTALAVRAEYLGRFDEARSLYTKSATLFQESGDMDYFAIARYGMATIALVDGDPDTAGKFAWESIDIFRQVGDRQSIARSLCVLGDIACYEEDYLKARVCYKDALEAGREIGDRLSIAQTIEGFATMAMAWVQVKRTVQLLGAAEAIREAINCPLPYSRRPAQERLVTMTRRFLAREQFFKAWTQGKAMSLERVLELALAIEPPLSGTTYRSYKATRWKGYLSARELDVIALVAQGKTSTEIAGELVISVRTAQNHVNNILRKLGFSSRSQIVELVNQ